MDDVKECMTVVIALCIEATREGNCATDSFATEVGDDTKEGGEMDRRGIGDGILAGGGDGGLGAGGKGATDLGAQGRLMSSRAFS